MVCSQKWYRLLFALNQRVYGQFSGGKHRKNNSVLAKNWDRNHRWSHDLPLWEICTHIWIPRGMQSNYGKAMITFLVILWGQQIKKQAISRILSCLTIDLDPTLLRGSIRLPTSSRALLSNTGLLGVSPYRVYLISLQPNCTFFLLHWSYPLGGRRALPAILRYGVRTFLCTCVQR